MVNDNLGIKNDIVYKNKKYTVSTVKPMAYSKIFRTLIFKEDGGSSSIIAMFDYDTEDEAIEGRNNILDNIENILDNIERYTL